MLSKNKLGLVVGSFFGLCHLAWSVLVAIGSAQWLTDWIFRLHFIQPPYTIMPFRVGLAIGLIALTSIVGYVSGYLFGAIWNWLRPSFAD